MNKSLLNKSLLNKSLKTSAEVSAEELPRRRGRVKGVGHFPGAPPKPPEERTHRLDLSVPLGLLSQVKAEAKREGLSVSRFVCRILRQYFDEAKIL